MPEEPLPLDWQMVRAHEDIPLKDGKSIKLGITTRYNGVSQAPYTSLNMGYHVGDDPNAVTENRRLLEAFLGLSTSRWVQSEQVHGNRSIKVTDSDAGLGALDTSSAVTGADGLYTDISNLVLTACYADCVPVYLYAEDVPAVGLVHAGWRGTCGEIAGKTVEAMSRVYSIKPESIRAVIGPSIHQCCYEVDQRVIEHVQRIQNVNHQVMFKQNKNGRFQLNLQALNQEILKKYGVANDQISISHLCTGCRTDYFYSHRKENGRTGRMLSYIAITDGVD